jgi:hypothetical protein
MDVNAENRSEIENLMKEERAISFDPECVRKKSNWSKTSRVYKFDDPSFEKETLLKDISNRSPKLETLLNKIDELDARDEKQYGKKFKHFIFSDLKYSNFGAKMLSSALVAKGMHLGYSAELISSKKERTKGGASDSDSDSDSDGDSGSDSDADETKPVPTKKPKKQYKKIEMHPDDVLLKTKYNNFYLLSSVSVYDQNMTVDMKKHVLKTFNKRPDNIFGELARIIIMDSGFKEGIDLFDIKYIHIFEPPTVTADQKQVIGRGTRTCGQKGLEFHPQQGWPLYVYIYDLSIPEQLRGSFLNSASAMDLYLKTLNIDVRRFHFTNDLEKTSIYGAVDYELNKNIHSFSIPFSKVEQNNDANEIPLPEGAEFIYGGENEVSSETPMQYHGGGPKRKLRVVNEVAWMGFEELRKHVDQYYGEYKWDAVKMENLCKGTGKGTGGGAEVITYTPTQEFVRHYFTPSNPRKGILLWHSVGTGKCHAKDSPILMFDGSIKMVQNIEIGDLLMGDDSKPRTVLSLARGQDNLYNVVPIKGEKYTVNSEHILCLKSTRLGIREVKKQKNFPFVAPYLNHKTGKIISKGFATKEEANLFLDNIENETLEISVCNYLKLPYYLKKTLKGYRVGVHFSTVPVDFDPYIIGFWLGDGASADSIITTQDSKVLCYLFKELPKHNLSLNYQSQYDYRITSTIPKGENKFLKALQKYKLIKNKHIPNEYKINSKEIRLQLLAGLIDSDGYKDNSCYEITQKNKVLAEDILFLCRSLGFAANMKECEKSCMYKGEKRTGTYYRIYISGDLDEVPVKISRKKTGPRLQKKNVLVTGINVDCVGRGDYYGFTLDGNNRYLLGDFTVTHNTASAIATATSSFERQGYTILWVTRTTLKNDIWKNMFDQVCNERLRYQIQNQGLVIPEEQNKRMKLLSDAWRIRPMSYKQFSNLVAKQNDFYRRLVKKNGEADPLRKTLLIIDEAHKLYGGGLSSIEQPDMAAFHQAVMNSYMISKEDSVKLLLMTATPIAKDPMELIRLLNLCKTPAQQMPADFQEFSNQHLNEMGEFTKEGRDKYLDEIAGYISYLNREKDARQFAQPILQYIQTPMAAPKTLKQVGDFDQRIVREFLSSDIPELKQQILENQQQLVADLVDVDTNTFKHVMREVCEGKTGKEQKQCEKISKQNVKEMVRETKEYVKDIRRQIKELRDAIKNKNLLKREALATVSENRNRSEADYETYKESMVYNLKNKCAIRVEKESDFKTKVGEYPQIRSYNEDIANYEEQIKSLYAGLKSTMMAYKSNIARLQKIVKSPHTTALEKSVVRMNIRDVRLEQNKAKRETQKKIKAEEKDIQKNIKDTRKKREVTYKQLKKTVKKALSMHKKDTTVIQKAERKLRKTLRKQEDYAENIQHGVLKNIVDKYVPKIKAELETESPKKVGVVDKETRKKKSQLPMSASTTTRKRCPKGYRKDKHGECVKKT